MLTTGLTEKQRRWVAAFMGEAVGNATEAARLAGYRGNDNTLASVGAENLRKPAIAAAIAELQAECPLTMTRRDRQVLWSQVARGEVTISRSVKVGSGDAAEIIEVEDTPSIADRLRASELLAKSAGDFAVRHEHKPVSASVVVYIPDDGSGPPLLTSEAT